MITIPDHSRSERLRALRLGNIKTLLRWRYGPELPDDDAGREDLRELLLPVSVGPHADVKMPKMIEVWASWMGQDEAAGLIDQINRTPIWERKPNAKELGIRLRVTNGERERLKLWTIVPYDMSAEDLLAQRQAKARERMRRLRQLRGARSHAYSTRRQKLWEKQGISRATWYRKNRETNSCALILVKAANESVSPEQASKPRTASHPPPAGRRASKPTKAERVRRAEGERG